MQEGLISLARAKHLHLLRSSMKIAWKLDKPFKSGGQNNHLPCCPMWAAKIFCFNFPACTIPPFSNVVHVYLSTRLFLSEAKQEPSPKSGAIRCFIRSTTKSWKVTIFPLGEIGFSVFFHSSCVSVSLEPYTGKRLFWFIMIQVAFSACISNFKVGKISLTWHGESSFEAYVIRFRNKPWYWLQKKVERLCAHPVVVAITSWKHPTGNSVGWYYRCQVSPESHPLRGRGQGEDNLSTDLVS